MKTLATTLSLLALSAFSAFAATNEITVTGSVATQGFTKLGNNDIPKINSLTITSAVLIDAFLNDPAKKAKDYQLVLVDGDVLAVRVKATGATTKIGTVTLKAFAADALKKKYTGSTTIQMEANVGIFSGFSGSAVGTVVFDKYGDGAKIVSGTYAAVGNGSKGEGLSKPVIKLNVNLKKEIKPVVMP